MAERLFVDQKPSVAHWMLAPSGDICSSKMLEFVQNQFQIQGFEVDYTIVFGDADLRRGERWSDKAELAGKLEIVTSHVTRTPLTSDEERTKVA